MTDEADIILAQIRARRAEAQRQARALDPNLKRFVAALELPYFVLIEIHAKSEDQVRSWFDCPDDGVPQTIPIIRDAMKQLPWKQCYSFGGKSIPKVTDVSGVKHVNVPGVYVGQIPSEEAIKAGYTNVDELVRNALEEEARVTVLPWAVADKETREVVAVYRTRAKARIAREVGQVVGDSTSFYGWQKFARSDL